MANQAQERDAAYKNGLIYLAAGRWDEATCCFDAVLKFDSKHDHAYIGKLCCELKINAMSKLPEDFDPQLGRRENYQKALQHAAEPLKSTLVQFSRGCQLQGDYKTACRKSEKASTYEQLRDVADLFSRIGDYKDSEEQSAKYNRKAINRKNRTSRIIKIASFSSVAIALAFIILFFTAIQPANRYQVATELLLDRRYNEAISAFIDLGHYKDSKTQVMNAQNQLDELNYLKANDLLNNGKYNDAIIAFENLSNYKDSAEMAKEAKYFLAIQYIENEQNGQAAGLLIKLAGYKDSSEKARTVLQELKMIVTLNGNNVWAVNNGRVVSNCDVINDELSGWSNMSYILDAGTSPTIIYGLSKNGDFYSAGHYYKDNYEITGKKIIQFDEAYPVVLGVSSQNTVINLRPVEKYVFSGKEKYILASRCEELLTACEWTNIELLALGDYSHVLGLKTDGSIVACGNNENSQCNVGNWNDIIDIVASSKHSIGLKADGTVVAIGNNDLEQCDVSEWENIICIEADGDNSYGIDCNGQLFVAGRYSTMLNGLKDIICVAKGYGGFAAVKADGKVVQLESYSSNIVELDMDLW